MTDAIADRLRDAVRMIQALRGRVAELQADREPPIAIVGMACRYAGAACVDDYWNLLATGRDAVRAIPADRWDAMRWFSPDVDMPGRVAFREAAFLDEVDGFDNDLFGISAREAAQMDPQHRILLELAWEALEDGAIRPDQLAGAPCSVFLGLNGGDHLLASLAAPDRIGSHALAGAVGSIAAGRIAYTFGLSGPAMAIDTACSSSLVAVHLAVRALRSRECAIALAGGMHLMLMPNVSVALSRARMMSPDGRCKAFDAAADGFGQGEGGGIVVLKRLDDAIAEGDRVLAVIAGSALNQDGRSAGITAPNQGAQERVIRAALANAAIDPDAVDAIEAHGTGTALGDPIEMHALSAVFGRRARPLSVGSVKTNIGHTAAAAGIAGLIKSVLMLRRQAVPPSLYFHRLNPHIELGDAAIAVPTELTPRELSCVGVSSFGFSGTNAHVVLHAAPAPQASATEPAAVPGLLISAQTEQALRALIGRYRARLENAPESFADISRTAWVGRARLPWWTLVEIPNGIATAQPHNTPVPDPAAPVARERLVDLPSYAFQHRLFPRARPSTATETPYFPGRLIDTPSSDRQLECALDLSHMPWLADHRVGGRVVVPGAVMIALLLAVAPPDAALADILFTEPAVVDDTTVRLVALARPDGSLGVASRLDTGWVWHATARICDPAAPLGLVAPEPAEWMSRGEWVAHLADLGIEIGPLFQAIAQIACGPLSIAELDPAIPGELAGSRFHPALLDAALQVAGGTLPSETVLPTGIERLTIRGSLSGPLRVVARRAGERIDLEVLRTDSAVATIEGLAVRRLSDGRLPTVATLAWKAVPAAPGGQVRAEILEVAPHGANMAQALDFVHRRIEMPSAPIAFVTRGAMPPVGDPAAAQFVGLASALAEERPELGCRCIDVAADTPADLFEEELRRIDGEQIVALGPNGRFVPRLVPTQPLAGEPRLRGTVLISGGFGGIGRHVAGWAVARGAEAVLLVGRHGGTPPADVPVRGLALDVGAPDAAERLAKALTGLPPLSSVVHAAGILRDGLVENLTAADFAATLAPKLGGAWALHRLTERLPLDHFLLFGSVASLIGAAGQASYAAANAALDAFASWRQARGLPATAILWGHWTATGMATRLGTAQGARVAARGLLGMTPARALAALDAAIRVGSSAVMIAALDRPLLARSAPPAFAELLPPPAPVEGPVPLRVAAAVHQILGQEVAPGRSLIAYGLDSLMAVDLRNRLNRDFGIGLRVSELMGAADIDDLSAAVERAVAASAEIEELVL